MRDGSGNEFVGSGVLKDANGRPLGPQFNGPQEPGTVEVLRQLQAEYAELQEKFKAIIADHTALKAEHDETLKDIGAISDASVELRHEHEALKEVHAMAMAKIAVADAKDTAEPEKAEDVATEAASVETQG